ncbi:ATP-grasp domain-containing protein [Phenylobacterium sp.]|uniref:ATP-grasp domain-containing protein n=1 Tax=Phenylobacterium sp. TaxID=1871053 RepID=UPI002F93A4D8
MNVLILSAAAKVLLVRAFREAAQPRGGRVFAADLSRENAALFEADGALLLPRSDDPAFPDALLAACRAHDIRLVVPTRDGELAALAGLKARFAAEGIVLLVAEPEALATCRDKRRFVAFCQAHGFATPHTYAPGETPEAFPVFVRPAEGAGGAGARLVHGAQDLPADPGLLVQEPVYAPEYSIDVLMDLNGSPVQAVARERLQVRAGEAVKSRVVDAPGFTEPALSLCRALGLVGHNVVQAFCERGLAPQFIEVNPRFGGASNLSIRAGLASPERILQMLAGEGAAYAPRPIQAGLTLLRYAEDRLVTRADLAALAP